MNSPLDLAAVQAIQPAGDAGGAESRRHRVLLVDDEEGIVRSLRRLLRREPYDLDTAGSGEEALEKLASHPAHLILTDQRMPGMTGVELLREVRNRWPDTIRIILSGYTKVDTIIDAINDGEVYKYLTKPWNDEELKLNLRRALEQYELEAENRRLAEQVLAQNRKLIELNKMLEERALDAAAGLSSWQTLLETLRVGVVAIDENELIVAANRQAMELAAATQEFVGSPADTALKRDLYAIVKQTAGRSRCGLSGRLQLDGRACQWHVEPLRDGDMCFGNVITIWEEVK